MYCNVLWQKSSTDVPKWLHPSCFQHQNAPNSCLACTPVRYDLPVIWFQSRAILVHSLPPAPKGRRVVLPSKIIFAVVSDFNKIAQRGSFWLTKNTKYGAAILRCLLISLLILQKKLILEKTCYLAIPMVLWWCRPKTCLWPMKCGTRGYYDDPGDRHPLKALNPASSLWKHWWAKARQEFPLDLEFEMLA